MKQITLEGEEVREYIVKPFGNKGAHVILPKRCINKKIVVVFPEAMK